MRKYHHLGEDGECEVLWDREIEEKYMSYLIHVYNMIGSGSSSIIWVRGARRAHCCRHPWSDLVWPSLAVQPTAQNNPPSPKPPRL